MKFNRFFTALSAVLLFVQLPLFAAPTKDPALVAAPDTRLDQLIDYKADGIMLDQVAKELTKISEVSITAGIGERDWKSKERKVFINARKLPLKTVLDEISKTLFFFVSHSTGKDGKLEYRIWQDLKGREFEKSIRISEEDAAEREVMALRQKVFDDAKAASKMSQAEADKLKTKDPWMAYLAGTDEGRAFSNLVNTLPPVSAELMMRGHKVSLNYTDMSPEMQSATKQFGEHSIMSKFDDTGMLSSMMKGMTPNKLQIETFGSKSSGAQGAGQFGFAGMIMLMGKAADKGAASADDPSNFMSSFPMAMMPMVGSDSVMGKTFGKLGLKLNEGAKMSELGSDFGSELTDALGDLSKKKFKKTEKPTDLDLLQEVGAIKLEGKQDKESVQHLIDELSKQTKLSYIVEYEPGTDVLSFSQALPQGKMPLYQFLDNLQLANYSWEYGNHTVRIRPTDWAIQRSYDIQESFMNSYRTLFKTKGWFDLDDLGTIAASLTDGQIMNRFLKDPVLLYAGLPLMQMPFGDQKGSLIRLYGTLTPPQKLMIKSADGLPLSSLNDDQWQMAADFIEDENSSAVVQSGIVKLTISDRDTDPYETIISNSTPPSEEKDKSSVQVKVSVTKSNDEPAKKEEKISKKPVVKRPIINQSVLFSFELANPDDEKPIKIDKTINIPTKLGLEKQTKMVDQITKDAEKAAKDQAKTNGEKTTPK